MNRSSLPLRPNCEGYFVDSKGNILAQATDKGYALFPGGGIDNGEDPAQAIVRETFEETGARVHVTKHLGRIISIWPTDWAKTDKQKMRYKQYRGDEMHFYMGVINDFSTPPNHEDAWQGQKLLPIPYVVSLIEQLQPFPPALADYYTAQLKFVKSLLTIN